MKDTSTEQHNPLTKNLSQVFQANYEEGLKLLHQVDLNVGQGYAHFSQIYLKKLATAIDQSLETGGRLFMVGSGSSGRIAVDLAAKWKAYFKTDPRAHQVIGIIAGGAGALVRAKEGLEDSEEEGKKAMAVYSPTPQDSVILISASGSAQFNVGFGKEALDKGARLFYFYNSKSLPPKTEALFDPLQGERLLVDIGPQAISGSTRLQAATLATVCLGATLTTIIANNTSKLPPFIPLLESANQEIERHIKDIAQIVRLGVAAFSAPEANFRHLKDVSASAYVTSLGDEASIRDVLMDATETAPTFSTNPPRSKKETHKKKAEFRAYLLGETSNLHAWKKLSGQETFSSAEKEDLEDICLSQSAQGFGSFQDRPKGKNNLVMVALKSLPDIALRAQLQALQDGGAKTGLICLGSGPKTSSQEAWPVDGYVCLDVPPSPLDPLGIIQTVALKQTLNMISNGMMIGMHKVIGNRMVDVRLTNQKLIHRALGIVKDLKAQLNLGDQTYSDKELHDLLQAAHAYKNKQEEKGLYTPSAVKTTLIQIATGKTCQEAIEWLHTHGENVEGYRIN